MFAYIHLGSSINEHLATIIVGLVQLVSNIASLFVVDRAGRKPLLIGSGVLMCISTAAMGTAFYLNNHGIREYGCVLCTNFVLILIYMYIEMVCSFCLLAHAHF